MPTQGLCEIVLHVADVERSAAFYRDVVGLAVERPAGDDWAWFWTGEPGRSARLAVQSGPLLFEEASPYPPGKRWGRVHFAFAVRREEVVGRLRTLSTHGIAVHGPVDLKWMRARSWYFYDPDGNLAEFWSPQPNPDSEA